MLVDVEKIDERNKLLNAGALAGRLALIMPSSGTREEKRGTLDGSVMLWGSSSEKKRMRTDVRAMILGGKV